MNIQTFCRIQAKEKAFALCSFLAPSCMHVWSVMYECEKKHNCEKNVFFNLTCLILVFCEPILVLLLHEVGLFLLIIVLLSTQDPHKLL